MGIREYNLYLVKMHPLMDGDGFDDVYNYIIQVLRNFTQPDYSTYLKTVAILALLADHVEDIVH